MEKRYLSPKELSEYTGFSVYTIYLWIRERKISFIKKSRRILFDKEEIDKWLHRDKIKSADDYCLSKIIDR